MPKLKFLAVTAIVVCLAISNSCVAGKTTGKVNSKSGTFENLGVPVKRHALMNYMVGPDENGENNMLYFNFTGASLGGKNVPSLFLVQVDIRTGESKQYTSPTGNPGAWGMATGTDGKVYLGTWAADLGSDDPDKYEVANILCFDPKNRAKGLYLAGQPSQTETQIWMFTEGKNGKMYMGTSPNAKLVSYDPATGEMEDLGRMDPDASKSYVYHLAAGKNGWIYASIGGNIMAYNPADGQREKVFAEAGKSGKVYNVYGYDDAYVRIGNKNYVLKSAKAIETDTIPSKPNWQGKEGPRPKDWILDASTGKNMQSTLKTPLADGRYLAGADLNGNYYLYDPATDRITMDRFEYEGGGSSIYMVAEGPEGVIYGSSYIPLQLFAYDPAFGKTANPGNPSTGDGEIYSMVPWQGDLFMASYSHGDISRYDPKKPWNNEPFFYSKNIDSPDKNPRNFGSLGKGHLRQRSIMIGPEEKIYIGSTAGYGTIGGAMAVFDPVTNTRVNYREPFTNEGDGVAALAYDPQSGQVFGGTNNGRFFSWDLVEKKIDFEMIPVEADWGPRDWWDYNGVIAMEVVDGKVFMLCGSGRWIGSFWQEELTNTLSVFDIKTRKIIHQAKINFGKPREVAFELHTDGLIYGLTDTSIYTVNPKTYEARVVAQSPVDIYCGWALTDTGIYFGSGVNLWRYKW